MLLFNIKNNNLTKIKNVNFNLEKEIQEITEINLEKVFDLKKFFRFKSIPI